MQVQSSPSPASLKELAAKARAMKGKELQAAQQGQGKSEASIKAQLKAKLAERAQEQQSPAQVAQNPAQNKVALSGQEALALRNQMAGRN